MTQVLQKPRVRVWPLLVFFAVAGTALTAAYFAVKNFLNDRRAAMSYKTLPTRPVFDRPNTPTGRQVKTYTAKELEEARRKGQLPPGVTPPAGANPATAANDAAVQRSLRALEEINRINRMNQQLMEQQQRMNRQKN